MTMIVAVDRDAVALSGGDPSVMGEILRPALSLAIWWREAPVALAAADAGSFEPIRFEGDVRAVAASLRAELGTAGHASWHDSVADDAEELAARFADIMDLDRVRVRLEPVSTNACWRFHADSVSARLITTYYGPGTQWVRADEPEPRPIHQLKAGDVGIFKGRLADPEARILHRSPPVGDTGDCRILLVIDPPLPPAPD